jgi:hypothetical protein
MDVIVGVQLPGSRQTVSYVLQERSYVIGSRLKATTVLCEQTRSIQAQPYALLFGLAYDVPKA